MTPRACIECNEPESDTNPLGYQTTYCGEGYVTIGPLCQNGYACGMRFWGVDAYGDWTPPAPGEFLGLPVSIDLTEADGADTANGAERWLRGERTEA